MKMKISILTATYNHPNHLSALYKSLLLQEDKEFVWVVVNDGSRQETDDLVKKFITESKVKIRYKYQQNKGKSAAINQALDMAMDSDFVVIVDDDEELFPNAINIVHDYCVKYHHKNIGCINFNRADKKGNVLSNTPEKADFVMSCQQHKSLGLHADGYAGYFMDILGKKRFPLFEGERYVGPSVLQMIATVDSDMLWASAVLGRTEYLEGGITQKGRKLRLKNPRGMIYHAACYMNRNSNMKMKLGYSTRAFAYKYYAGFSTAKLQKAGIDMSIFYPMQCIGIILASIWKMKFGHCK